LKKKYLGSEIYVWNDLFWEESDGPEETNFIKNAVSSGGPTRFESPPYQSSLNNKAQFDKHCYDKEQCRHYPDISFAGGGSVNYLVPKTNAGKNDVTITGGTSASAPLFAAMVAVLNSEIKLKHKDFSGLGFVNSLLYQWKDEPGMYKDVKKGSNCTLFDSENEFHVEDMICYKEDADPLFMAQEGFDLTTGIGELQGKAFMKKVMELLKKKD